MYRDIHNTACRPYKNEYFWFDTYPDIKSGERVAGWMRPWSQTFFTPLKTHFLQENSSDVPESGKCYSPTQP